MNKQPSFTIMTRLCWGVFFLALLFLAFHVIPRTLGQQDASKRSAAEPKANDVGLLPANAPKFPALSTRAPGAPISKATGISKRVSEVAERTSGPTGVSGDCQFHVLIVYADGIGLPTQLQSEIQAEPNVVTVDLFDATIGTPTLGQLQQYEIVVPFSNNTFLDGDTLGNNLADYVDGGGIVVQYGFAHYGPDQPYGVNGRWLTGGYNPYDYSTNLDFNSFSLGTFDAGHPLMAGVTTLNSNFANVVTPNAAATEVAQNNFGESLVAFRPVSGGHTTVGVTAYVGADATQSGDWGRVVVNAGNWLLNCQGTPTPTPTPSCTPIVVNGSIDFSEPTQAGRLTRDGIASSCAAPKTCPGLFESIPHFYDSYTFTNTTGSTQCVTVDLNTACTGTNYIFSAAYLGSFDPNNLCTNYLADEGASPDPQNQYSFDLDAGQTVDVVVHEVFGADCPAYTVTITGLCDSGGELTLVSAASRKKHGDAGTFDIDLPLTGTPGVECRVGNGGTFLQRIVFTFSEAVTSISGATTTTCGTVNSTTISGSTVTVELGHVNCDGSDITVTVLGVNGASGSVDASATMTLRTGDVNADGVVNNTDLKEIKMNVGRGLVNDDNFRDDITVDGKVNHGDTTLEKSKL